MECIECEHKAVTETQLKLHMATVHPKTTLLEAESAKQDQIATKYNCNFCDHTSETLEHIVNHQHNKHPDQAVNLNNLDKSMNDNILASVFVEQFNGLVDEVLNMKKAVKDILGQVIDDYENNMNFMREENTKNTIKTNKSLQKIHQKIEILCSISSKQQQSPPASSNESTPSTDSLSSKTEGSGEPCSPPNNSNTRDEKKKLKKKTFYQTRPKLLMVGDSVAHNSNFRIVEEVTNCTIKTAKAYSSKWNERARFKHSNVTQVVKDELEKSNFDHLVIAAPTVDITNLNTKNANKEDSIEPFKSEIEDSCRNLFKVAENALENNVELKKVTIMEHPPRFDTFKEDPI